MFDTVTPVWTDHIQWYVIMKCHAMSVWAHDKWPTLLHLWDPQRSITSAFLSESQVHEDPKKIQIKAKMQYKLAFQGQTLYIARAGDFGVISIKWPLSANCRFSLLSRAHPLEETHLGEKTAASEWERGKLREGKMGATTWSLLCS